MFVENTMKNTIINHNSICDKEEYKNSHVPQNDSPNSTVAFVDQSKSIFPANTSALIFG